MARGDAGARFIETGSCHEVHQMKIATFLRGAHRCKAKAEGKVLSHVKA